MAKKSDQSSRRKFLRDASVVGAGILIVPRHVLGRGYIAPSDKLNIAGIGVGGKGAYNLEMAHKSGAANIVALCDVDDRQSADGRKKYDKASYHKDYRELLEGAKAKEIDAVIISTPDHMHAVQALPFMQLKKHVYVEKPLTHDIYEARVLTQAAEKYKVVTQMGNQGSSGNDTRIVESWIQQGVIGDVHTVHVWTNRPVWPQGIPTPTGNFTVPSEVNWNLWIGTAPYREYNPTYIPANWRGWVDFGTGALGDMGCHFIDVPYRALKLRYPIAVECSVGRVWSGFFKEEIYTDSYPPSSKIHIQFPARDGMPPVEMIWYDGGILPKRPAELLPDEEFAEWDGGILFEGTRGKLVAGLFGRNPKLLPTSKMKDAKLPAAQKPFVKDGWDGHQAQWIEACKKGYGTYTSSSFSEAGPLTETVLMGNLAVRSFNYSETDSKGGKKYPGRKKLLWDGENMKITNFDPANQFAKRRYRDGWKLEV